MEDTTEHNPKWERRESKKKSKKTFSSDNRKSVRWLSDKAGQKSKDIQKAKNKKEKEEWLLS